MLNSEMKNVIAENCESYETKFKIVTMSVGRLNESCSNCINFRGEKCTKGLFNEMKDIISVN
ncbi:hypothetical protein [Clostridium arbusti]|uniref:hypothetical protein n=1 Tax=Clostridium arbusti TaxID=1137848 RepID=UPI000287F13B|nr:hypothetical protein [Clostridium arbusti]